MGVGPVERQRLALEPLEVTSAAARLRQHLSPVVLLTAGMAASGATLAVAVRDVPVASGAPFQVPFLGLLLVVLLAERFVVHLHFRGETHSFSLGEVSVALGLFLAPPLVLVAARAIGVFGWLVVRERQRGIKAVFNGALAMLDAATAAVIWVALGGPEHGASTLGLLIGAAAVTAGAQLGHVLVWLVIGITQGRLVARDLVETTAVAVPISLANIAVALSAVAVTWVRPDVGWVALVPLTVLFVCYRAYVSERHRRDAMGCLYELSQEVHGSADAAASLSAVSARLREYLEVDRVEVYVWEQGARVATAVTARQDGVSVDQPAVESLDTGIAGLLTRSTPTEHLSPREALVSASVGRTGRLVVRAWQSPGSVDAFDHVAFDLLRSALGLVVTILQSAELNEMKTAFLSAVSHELRTPLAVVMGTATTLRHRRAQLRPDQTELLTERLEAHANRLDKLLTDLLDIDRLARGVVEPRRREVDVSLMASRLVDALEVSTHPVKLYGTGVRGFVDGPQLERIIENLVRNAVKYTPAGTPIEISLQRLPEGVRVLVEDRGPGVPDAAKNSILEPFVRLDADHPSPGTGIGLSLVRRFAQLHGGDIEVSDRPGGGATFSVLLIDDRPELAEPADGSVAGAGTAGSVVPLRPPA